MSKLIFLLTLEAFILHVFRCVILSFDDGTMRILSLVKAAYDAPVTGKPFGGTKQQGLHSYYCSSFAIWNVQVSRLTGIFFFFFLIIIINIFFISNRNIFKYSGTQEVYMMNT
jgi:hypothetical protein